MSEAGQGLARRRRAGRSGTRSRSRPRRRRRGARCWSTTAWCPDASSTWRRPKAERIFVGKDPTQKGGSGFSQQQINDLLVAKAREGKRVVRLKGGDPFVFGRGGEEAEALAAAGIPFEVVPGVSSAIAAPAYAGIPVTHRRLSSSFTVVTGHEDPEKPESAIDWARIAKSADTLVILMGGANLGEIMKRLADGGRAPDEPVAVVRWGTTPEQRSSRRAPSPTWRRASPRPG